MPLLNFKPQFVAPIQAGAKSHTIRADRAIPIKPGDKLYLYTGLRRKGAARILPEPVTCTMVQPIKIRKRNCCENHFVVTVDGTDLARDERERLAVADGFLSFAAMMTFWEGRLPFKGQIIYWRAQ